MDSQSVKTTEEPADPSDYNAHKNVKGRKRHLLVDTLGLVLSVYVTPADVQDRVGAQYLLAGLKAFLPRLKKIWADGAYTGEKLSKDYERLVQSSETFIEVAMIRLVLRRLVRGA